MKRFSFRLAQVLRLRKVEEERAHVALASANIAHTLADAVYNMALDAQTDAIGALHASIHEGERDPAWPSRMAEHARRLELAVAVALKSRNEAKCVLDGTRSEFDACRKARRVLEELESQARVAYLDAAKVEEQMFLDESASLRHGRSTLE